MTEPPIAIYLIAIDCELKKRATTYRKIREKAKKDGIPAEEFDGLIAQQHGQNRKLQNAAAIIQARANLPLFHREFVSESFVEIVRVLQKMVKKYGAKSPEAILWTNLAVFFKNEILEKCASSSSST